MSSKSLIFEARPDWHAASLCHLPTHKVNNLEIYADACKNLKEYALNLLESDRKLYAAKQLSSSSSQKFLSTIMISGTLSDKVSALTLVIQESPVHTQNLFESLLGLSKKRSRGQAVIALAAVKDLLGAGSVLPSNRRLFCFEKQPGLLGTLYQYSVRNWKFGQKLPGNISEAHLISWAFEDWLKQTYFEILKILETWCNDEVEYARARVVTYIYELLREKPEQEVNLLRLLVNKLGDPDRKISSRASHLILQLQISHPLMKPIIIRSIESEILLRPGQTVHAKYYAIITLNQTILSTKESDLAKNLLRIYFELFVSLFKSSELLKPADEFVTTVIHNDKIKKDSHSKQKHLNLVNQELIEKMISAVLTGVNRAFPFSKSDDHTLEGQLDTLFRITHSSNFNTSIQALLLIEQLATSKNISVDRFYRTLYESLLDPRLISSSKHALYLNLIYRSLRSDVDTIRIKSFVKRMVQIITLHQPPFICGILYLLKELEVKFPSIRTLFTQPQENEADEEIFFDVPDSGNTATVQTSDRSPNHQIKYDGKKRDPRYNNVNNSCLWELIPFTVHFHPSVSLFATRLLNDGKMPLKPDMASHSLSNFLDRFVYRNAKDTSTKLKGNSIMQPLSGFDGKSIFLSHKGVKLNQKPLNSESFWHKNIEDIAVDEVFFHKYFSQIGKSKISAKKESLKKRAQTFDAADEDEDEVWKALVRSEPGIEGQDNDMDMPDIDDCSSESSAWDLDGNAEVDLEASDFSCSDIEEQILCNRNSGHKVNKLSDQVHLKSAHDKKDNFARRKKNRFRMKNLPIFASVEEYADMLEE